MGISGLTLQYILYRWSTSSRNWGQSLFSYLIWILLFFFKIYITLFLFAKFKLLNFNHCAAGCVFADSVHVYINACITMGLVWFEMWDKILYGGILSKAQNTVHKLTRGMTFIVCCIVSLHQLMCHFVFQPAVVILMIVAVFYRGCTGRKWGLHSNPQSEDLKTLFILTPSSPPEHPLVTKNTHELRYNEAVNWWVRSGCNNRWCIWAWWEILV